jgi:DNA-binding XRE family transcriptional regulator
MQTAKQVASKKKPKKGPEYGPLSCRVRSEREGMGLSLDDVAGATRISKSTLSYLERGFDAQLSTALKIARFFNLPLDRLWVQR